MRRGVPAERLFAVFISNPDQRVPLWRQRAGDLEYDGLVLWDYHVIAIEAAVADATTATATADGATCWDLDTKLPFPCPLDRYAAEVFRHHPSLSRPEFQRCACPAGSGSAARCPRGLAPSVRWWAHKASLFTILLTKFPDRKL